MPIEIIPAILPRSFKDLSKHLSHLRGVSRKVQVDVFEGGWLGFGRTWPMRNRGSFEKLARGEGGLPYWTEFDTEVDLMVSNPKELALAFVRLHVSRVILHAAFAGALEAAQVLSEYEDDEHQTPLGLGLALTVNDKIEALEPFEHLIDFVQVMGIAKVGKQGRPFDERALPLIERLRHRYPELPIQVDGGVAPHVRELVRAGANRLVVGSAIVKAKNPGEVYKKLYTEANAR